MFRVNKIYVKNKKICYSFFIFLIKKHILKQTAQELNSALTQFIVYVPPLYLEKISSITHFPDLQIVPIAHIVPN